MRVAIAVVCVALLGACSPADNMMGNPNGPSGPTGPTGATGPTGPASSGFVDMQSSIDPYGGGASNSFSPASVTILKDGSVTWTNSTGVTHNVTFASATGAPQNIPDFNSGTQTRQFGTAGSFAYQCTNHSGMSGTVVVQ